MLARPGELVLVDPGVLSLAEVRERTEIDIGIALLAIGGDDHEAERRDSDETADHTAEAERGELEELAPREPLTRRRLRHCGLAPVRGDRCSVGRRRRSA